MRRMLLSTYLMYRLARSARLKWYILIVTLFIIVISYASAFYFWGMFISFPFYSWWTYTRILENDQFHSISYYGIRFLLVDITQAPYSETLPGGTFVSHNHHHHIIAFSFFLAVNTVGALLGYWMGKKYRIQLLSGKSWIVVCFISIGLATVLGRVLPIAMLWAPFFGFATFLLEKLLIDLLFLIRIRTPKKKLLDYIKDAGAYY